MVTRNKTPPEYVYRGLYLYFSGLSLRRTSERLSYCIKRNHVTIWNWIQKYQPKIIKTKQRRICEFIVDETLLKVGSEYTWLWVAIDAKSKEILALSISKERNMFVAERFLLNIIRDYGKHPVSTDDGGTWYPMACQFLKLEHHLHSSYEKSLIERTIQYIKDRTENFDDYFPCRIKNCNLKHVKNWLNLFVDYHNKELKPVNWTEPAHRFAIRIIRNIFHYLTTVIRDIFLILSWRRVFLFYAMIIIGTKIRFYVTIVPL